MPSISTSHDENAPAIIVARPIGALDASGSASLTTLQEVSVSINYDDLYDVTLSAADSTKIANAFTVSGNGGSFAATLSSSSDFQDVLAAAMAAATCTTHSSAIDNSYNVVGVNLKDNLYNEMLTKFKKVFEDLLPNILESDWALSNDVNYAGGASDMAGKITDPEAEIIAQQLPESNYSLYMDASENPTTSALPVKEGDKLVFVFDVTESAVARVDKKTAGTNADSNNAAPAGQATPSNATAGSPGAAGSGPYGVNQQSIVYSSNSRKVAFQLTLRNSQAAGNHGVLDSLKA